MGEVQRIVPDIRPIGPSGSVIMSQPNNVKGFEWAYLAYPTGLNDLVDVTLTSVASGQFLMSNGVQWVNSAYLAGSGYSIVQVSGNTLTQRAKLNFLGTGIYLSDNNSNGSTDVRLASGLNNLSQMASNGFIVQTGVQGFTARIFASGSNKLSIGYNTGQTGNPIFDVREGNIDLNNVSGVLNYDKGGTNLSWLGNPNNLLGVNNAGDALEYKAFGSSNSSISIDNSAEDIDIYVVPGNISINDFANTLNVNKGGTGRTSFPIGSFLMGSGTVIAVNTGNLFFDFTNQRLGFGTTVPSSTIHFASAIGPIFKIEPRSLLGGSVPKDNTVEYDGTRLYLTNNLSIRGAIATTGDNLTNFVGILPFSRGGTSVTGFASGSLAISDGQSLIAFNGLANNEIPVWSGNVWRSSSGSYVSLAPTTTFRNSIVSQAPNIIPLSLASSSLGQTTGYFHIYDAANRPIFVIDKNGHIGASGSFTNSGMLTVEGLVTFNKGNGALGIASGNILPSIWQLGNALQGINFGIHGIELRNANGQKAIYVNTASGIVFTQPLTIASGAFRTHIDVQGTGNIVIFPTGNGTLALVSQIPTGSLGGGGISISDAYTANSVSGDLLTYNSTTGIIGLTRETIWDIFLRSGPISYTTGTIGLNMGSASFKTGVMGSINVSGGLLTYNSATGTIGLTRTSLYDSFTARSPLTYTTGSIGLSDNSRIKTITAVFQGFPVVSGQLSNPIIISYTGQIAKMSIFGNATGSIQVDVKKSIYSNYPVASSICSTNIPIISNNVKNRDTSLTSWTSGLMPDDILIFAVTSGNNLMSQVTVSLDVRV